MKRVDIAMVPVPQELMPKLKKNIKRMGLKIDIPTYLEHVIMMHSQVLDQLDKDQNNEV